MINIYKNVYDIIFNMVFFGGMCIYSVFLMSNLKIEKNKMKNVVFFYRCCFFFYYNDIDWIFLKEKMYFRFKDRLDVVFSEMVDE